VNIREAFIGSEAKDAVAVLDLIADLFEVYLVGGWRWNL